MDPLIYLTYIAVILLLGILCTLLSQRLKISNILLLLVAGMIAGRVSYMGSPLVVFPEIFLTSISILALVMIVFDSASRFKFREFDKLSANAIKLAFVFLLLNLVLLTISARIIFGINSIFLALVFSSLMSGTASDAVLVMLGEAKSRVFSILKVESILNTPLVVLIPFLVIDLMKAVPGLLVSELMEQLAPFLQQFVAGIGAGILVGVILFKIMKKQYSETLSPIALITAALLTYILAENLGGNGVLAVTILGLFFGNLYVKEKAHLHEFSSMFANTLEILVFVLVGIAARIPLTFGFFIKSLSLFFVYLLIRFLAVNLSFQKQGFALKEKIFMALNVQKGIAVAVVAFTLTTLKIEGIEPIISLILIFMLYSIILSTVVIKFSKRFVNAGEAG